MPVPTTVPSSTLASITTITEDELIGEEVATTTLLPPTNAQPHLSAVEGRSNSPDYSADYEDDVADDYEDSAAVPSDAIKLLPEIIPTAADYEEGFCVLDNRVSCGEGGISGDLSIPCARNTRPQPIQTQKEMDLLREVCPEFLDDLSDGEKPTLCCDLRGLRELKNNYELPKQLGLSRCPSCFYNFRRIFCSSTCSPKQSQFVRVDKSVPVPVGNETLQQVTEMTYVVAKQFADELYDSCKSK